MLRQVIELARRAEGGGEALLYYAGHGVQIADTNYLLPVDFDGGEAAMLPFEAVSLNDIGNQLLDAKTCFSLLIVDACRNNPLPGRRGRNLRTGPGLAPMSPATGQMVVYAAGSGQVALDGLGDRDPIRNGIFASEFAREMRTPGIDVREMMLTVRESVERLAASVNHAQRPAIYDESRGRFVFHEAPAATALRASPASPTSPSSVQPAPAAQPPVTAETNNPPAPLAAAGRGKSAEQIEDELWATFSNSNSRAAIPPTCASIRTAATRRQRGCSSRCWGRRISIPLSGRARPASGGNHACGSRTAGREPSVAAVRPSTAGPVVGRRYRGMDGQFDLTVEAQQGSLVVKAFRMTTGRFSGTELRCGAFSNTIELDEHLNVSACCSGVIPGSLRLRALPAHRYLQRRRVRRRDHRAGGGQGGPPGALPR